MHGPGQDTHGDGARAEVGAPTDCTPWVPTERTDTAFRSALIPLGYTATA